MKKLMIAAAIVCAAALSQAAAIDWSATNVADPWTSETAGKLTPANGWLGYVVLAADLSTVTTDLANNDTASLVAKAVGPVKTSSNKGAFQTGTASGNVAAGSQDFYLIVLNSGTLTDADYFFVSDKVTETVDAALDTPISFLKQTGTSDKGNWTAMSVPEPTSGLLLLLGVAGLALKRRRA